MKKLIFGIGLMIAGLTTSLASAQDYCCPVQYDPYCDPCCDYGTFDGFYIGGNLGVYTDVLRRNNFHNSDEHSFSGADTDFTIGFQLGYDWVCGNRLLGLVADWNWVNNDRRHHGDDWNCRSDFNWFTTIRLRAGLTFCDALMYVTLGAAVEGYDVDWHHSTGNRHHYDDTHWGWTGGVGAEFLAWCNWSIGAEVLFMHFTDDHHRDDDRRLYHSDSAWVGRLIVNYRFGDLLCCN